MPFFSALTFIEVVLAFETIFATLPVNFTVAVLPFFKFKVVLLSLGEVVTVT